MTLTCEDPVLDFVHVIVCVPASDENGVYEFQISAKTLTDVFGMPKQSRGDVLYVTKKYRAEIVAAVERVHEDGRSVVTAGDLNH